MRLLKNSPPILLFALLVLPACNVFKDKATLEQQIAKKEAAWGPPLQQPAPEIDALDTEGKPLRLSEQRGKVVLLSFWAHF